MALLSNLLQLKIVQFIIAIITQLYYRVSPKHKLTTVLLESNHFILINKAYDVKINSNNTNEKTVQTFMKSKYPTLASKDLYHEYYFMHRLDYSTSGIMCIPVHKKACQIASKAMESRRCRKYYLALVRGHLSSDLLDLNYPIGQNVTVTDIEKMCILDGHNNCKMPRQSRTVLIVLDRGLFGDYPATKLLIRPITGRRHQIRVHCSHIGHTIVGDYTYSNRRDVTPFRMFLHSFRLVLPNNIEDIDHQTQDPFNENQVQLWRPIFKGRTLEEAFRDIDEFICNYM